MVITIVCDVLGEPNNGTSIAAYNLIQSLKNKGHEVRVICPDAEKINEPGFYIVPKFNAGPLNDYVKKNGVVISFGDNTVMMRAILGSDIVHAMMPLALGRKAAKICIKYGIPLTAGFHVSPENLTSHFFAMKNDRINTMVFKNFYKHFYKYCSGIHYPTLFVQNYFEKTNSEPTNGYVISNGIASDFKREPCEKPEEFKNKFVILFTGRFSKEKSHKVLIKAVSLSKHGKDIQLIFAGAGPQEKKIKKLCSEKFKLTNQPLMKFFTHEELKKVINYADLYVHPAIVEIEPISCLEAVSCGLVPVIVNSPKWDTKKFAYDEKNLFKVNDSEDCAEKIDYWFEHPEEKKIRAEQYSTFLSGLSREKCMDQMENMLKDVVEAHKINQKKLRLNGRIAYYKDPLNDEFANNHIIRKNLPDTFQYVNKNPFYRFFGTILYYGIAIPAIKLVSLFKEHPYIYGRRNIKKIKKSGYFIYSNHVQNIADGYTIQSRIVGFKKSYVLCNEDAYSINPFISSLIKSLGAIPVTDNQKLQEKFYNCIKYRTVDQKKPLIIFPEAHIWPYYTGVREFGYFSFRYPVDFDLPVIAVATTFRERKFRTLLKPRINLTVSKPFYPDKSLDVKERMIDLRNKVFNFLKQTCEQSDNYEYIHYVDISNKNQ